MDFSLTGQTDLLVNTKMCLQVQNPNRIKQSRRITVSISSQFPGSKAEIIPRLEIQQMAVF